MCAIISETVYLSLKTQTRMRKQELLRISVRFTYNKKVKNINYSAYVICRVAGLPIAL